MADRGPVSGSRRCRRWPCRAASGTPALLMSRTERASLKVLAGLIARGHCRPRRWLTGCRGEGARRRQGRRRAPRRPRRVVGCCSSEWSSTERARHPAVWLEPASRRSRRATASAASAVIGSMATSSGTRWTADRRFACESSKPIRTRIRVDQDPNRSASRRLAVRATRRQAPVERRRRRDRCRGGSFARPRTVGPHACGPGRRRRPDHHAGPIARGRDPPWSPMVRARHGHVYSSRGITRLDCSIQSRAVRNQQTRAKNHTTRPITSPRLKVRPS